MLSRKKRNNSTASMATNKGLLNEPGENNCFLNSAIQVLWHLDVFRRSFRQLSGHACMGATCIFCALKDIFQQFQYSKDHALPPTVLRSALAETFQQENRFQLGLMDDAAECFENILLRIHVHIGNTVREDVCTAPHCIPHQKFGLTLVEQCVCACGATSEPLPFIEMVHYVSATALCTEDEMMRQRYGTSVNSQMFGRLIKVAGSWGDMRSCPSECGAQIEMRKVLMNCPDVVSIGIVWDSDEPQVRHIIDLVHALGTTLRIADLFHTVVDERASRLELYLVGMVCYYGKHYSTFFFHTKLRKWVYFDDAQVSEVGKRWSNVISKCIKGHHQPLLLLYANPNANPVSASTAPKTVTMLPGYSDMSNPRRDVIHDPITEISETNSLNSDESMSFVDEENSGTESMQLTVSQSPQKSKPRKNKSSMPGSVPQSTKPSSTTQHKHNKNKPNQSTFYVNDLQENEVQRSRTPTPVHNNAAYPIKGAQPESIEKTQVRNRKPTFQWNMADEQSRNISKKVGHYVEPNPANWTTYKPYSHQGNKHSAKNKANHRRNDNSESANKELAVKAVDSKGMATFCVTTQSPNGDNVSQRTPSPTPSSQSQQPSRVTLGGVDRQSPTSKLRRTSQSSLSSNSSAGRSTTGSGNTAQIQYKPSQVTPVSKPAPSIADPTPSASHASSSKYNPDHGTLHVSTGISNNTDTTPILTPTKIRPPLPPKPPFLSRPIPEFIKSPLLPVEENPTPVIKANPMVSLATMLQFANKTSQSRQLGNAHRHTQPDICKKPTTPDKCATLLRDADDLIEQSRAADNIMDYSSALQLCLEATKAIEMILTLENLPEEYMLQARMKHGECINRGRILNRRKNIRLQSQGSESGGTRLSMAEADRHMTVSANQIASTAQAKPVPSTSAPSVTNEKLIEHLEKNESRDNLINFDQHGVTSLQHNVHQMFEHQNQIKQHPNYRPPMGLIQNGTSNTNNNNSIKNTVQKPSGKSSSNLSSDGRKDDVFKDERTNIFVWRNPDDASADEQSMEQKSNIINKNVSSSDLRSRPATSNVRGVVSDSNLRDVEMKKIPPRNKNQRSIIDDEVKDSMKSMSLQSPRRFRSITPTPQTNNNDPAPSISHHRRSKTPTPSTNKDLLRSKQTMGQRRGANLKVRPKSAYDMSYNPSEKEDDEEAPVVPPRRKGNSKGGSDSDSPTTRPEQALYPHPLMNPWAAPPMMTPGVPFSPSPSMFPPGYYPYFYEMMKYYASLSPEHRSRLPFPMNNSTAAPPMFPPQPSTSVPPAMQAAFADSMRPYLGKNLTNLTNSVGRATPHIRNANSNIYESSKPKPLSKSGSNPRFPVNNKPENGPINRPTNVPVRRPPVETRPSSVYSRRDRPSANGMIPNQSHENDRPIRNERTPQSSFRSQTSDSNNATDASKTREGMMKWAEEGKKRTPDITMTPEYRKKILQEFANRPNKNHQNAMQSVLRSYPVQKVRPTPINVVPNNPVKVESPPSTPEEKDEQKCNLCGIAPASTDDVYCSKCRAYLARLKPTVNSLRTTKKT